MPMTHAQEREEASLGEMISSVLGALKRQRRWIVACGTVIPLIAAAIAMLLPDRYESSATLMVFQPRVPQRFVESTVVVGPTDAFLAVNREILSRSHLLAIVDEYSLYPKLRARGESAEQIAERMRRDIAVEGQDWTKGGDIVSFRMAYSADTPELAQKVTAKLASLFIEENLKKRNSQAETTTRFLTEQIENARKRMVEQEQKVRDYKVRNLEQLPQQQQALLGLLTDVRLQAQSVSASLVRAEQERSSLKAVLSNHMGRLQEERSQLLRKFTVKHPSVVKKEQEIERLQQLSARLSSGAPAGASDGVDDAQVAQLRPQVEGVLSETENLRREQNRLNAEISKNQALLRLTPVREQELTDILRDYELYKKDYADLLDKKLNADLSANLEQRNEGQQFRLVDPPGLPDRPAGPKRLKISLAALAAGIVLGVALAFFMGARSRVFYTEMALRRAYAVDLVVGIPSLISPSEEKKRRWTAAGEWAVTLCLALLVGAVQVYIYRNG